MAVDKMDIRTRKREQTRAEIVDAAWDLARRDGVAALSLHELAANLGMRAPSLYHYFPSKNALYDAMYAQGMQQFADRIQGSPASSDPHRALRNRARAFVDAAVADPARFELLFHRPIPSFVPSPEHLQLGLTHLARTRELAEAAGLGGERAFDLFMATTRGLIAMQIANEPGGDRWTRLVDEAVAALVEHYAGGEPARDRRKNA
jgi:AcrR family transcriptional regulator